MTRRGRPKVPAEDRAEIVRLRGLGRTYREIVEEFMVRGKYLGKTTAWDVLHPKSGRTASGTPFVNSSDHEERARRPA